MEATTNFFFKKMKKYCRKSRTETDDKTGENVLKVI